MIRDRAKMNLAGHRDQRLSENYFEPCNSKFMMIYLEKLCCIQKDASCEKSHLTLADEKPFEEAL